MTSATPRYKGKAAMTSATHRYKGKATSTSATPRYKGKATSTSAIDYTAVHSVEDAQFGRPLSISLGIPAMSLVASGEYAAFIGSTFAIVGAGFGAEVRGIDAFAGLPIAIDIGAAIGVEAIG
jgi:hypothetical protein